MFDCNTPIYLTVKKLYFSIFDFVVNVYYRIINIKCILFKFIIFLFSCCLFFNFFKKIDFCSNSFSDNIQIATFISALVYFCFGNFKHIGKSICVKSLNIIHNGNGTITFFICLENKKIDNIFIKSVWVEFVADKKIYCIPLKEYSHIQNKLKYDIIPPQGCIMLKYDISYFKTKEKFDNMRDKKNYNVFISMPGFVYNCTKNNVVIRHICENEYEVNLNHQSDGKRKEYLVPKYEYAFANVYNKYVIDFCGRVTFNGDEHFFSIDKKGYFNADFDFDFVHDITLENYSSIKNSTTEMKAAITNIIRSRSSEQSCEVDLFRVGIDRTDEYVCWRL